MGARREPPAEFVAQLRREFPDFVDLVFNETVNRWAFTFRSAAERPVTVFWGWDRNALTGEPIRPDPVTGLLPFRDLTPDAQAEIIRTGHATYIGNRVDGDGKWARRYSRVRNYNREQITKNARAKGDLYADMIREVDLNRPWVKYHKRSRKKQVFAPSGPLIKSAR